MRLIKIVETFSPETLELALHFCLAMLERDQRLQQLLCEKKLAVLQCIAPERYRVGSTDFTRRESCFVSGIHDVPVWDDTITRFSEKRRKVYTFERFSGHRASRTHIHRSKIKYLQYATLSQSSLVIKTLLFKSRFEQKKKKRAKSRDPSDLGSAVYSILLAHEIKESIRQSTCGVVAFCPPRQEPFELRALAAFECTGRLPRDLHLYIQVSLRSRR